MNIRILIILAAASLNACSGTLDDAIDTVIPKREAQYKSSRSLPPLEVPPDLSSGTLNDSLKVPAGGKGTDTFSHYNNAAQKVSAQGGGGVLPDLKKVHVERAGDKRWLVVEASPSQVWPQVRDFWLAQGFLIQVEDPSIGIMETDWSEQRSAIKGGLIQGLFERMSNAFYGVATRDKFRTRLERGENKNQTEIYVSHRGAEEVAVKNKANTLIDSEESRVWQPRPADPELEAEMLSRMMVFFGVEENSARQRIAQSRKQPSRAKLEHDGSGVGKLSLREPFSRAWRRTGLALDRVGFTVEDRDRSRGLYFVRYVDPDRKKEEKGFFSKLAFWSNDKQVRNTENDAYLISLIGGRDGQKSTQLVVLDKKGQRDSSATADRILSLLEEQLR